MSFGPFDSRFHASSNPYLILLSHRTPQILACLFLVWTFVSIPLTIASLGLKWYASTAIVLRTILINTIHNYAFAYMIVEAVSGVRFSFGRRSVNMGFEWLQRWGPVPWFAALVGYIYVVTDIGIRVHDRGHPTIIAALVFNCFQLTTVLLGFIIRTLKVVIEEGGKKSLDDVPPARGISLPDDRDAGSAAVRVDIDPNGVNDAEERRRLL